MAVLQVSTAPSRSTYDAVEQLVDLTGHRPAGMLIHAVAEQADGTVLMVDVWESDAAIDTFERDRLLPAFAAVPGAPMPIRPTRHATFHLVRA